MSASSSRRFSRLRCLSGSWKGLPRKEGPGDGDGQSGGWSSSLWISMWLSWMVKAACGAERDREGRLPCCLLSGGNCLSTPKAGPDCALLLCLSFCSVTPKAQPWHSDRLVYTSQGQDLGLDTQQNKAQKQQAPPACFRKWALLLAFG